MTEFAALLSEKLKRVTPNLSLFGKAIAMELEGYVASGSPLAQFEREVAQLTSGQAAIDLAGDDKDMRLNFTEELNTIREACLGALFEFNHP